MSNDNLQDLANELNERGISSKDGCFIVFQGQCIYCIDREGKLLQGRISKEEAIKMLEEDDCEPEPRYHVIIADWEDIYNDAPFESPKQYGLEIFRGTYSECRAHIDELREDYLSHPYSNFNIEERY